MDLDRAEEFKTSVRQFLTNPKVVVLGKSRLSLSDAVLPEPDRPDPTQKCYKKKNKCEKLNR